MDKSIYDSVSTLKGVAGKRLEALQQLGIFSILDLLSYYPFRYEDLQVKDLYRIADQEKVTLKGEIVADPVIKSFGYRKTRLLFRMAIGQDVIMVTFFNQPYLKEHIVAGEEITIYGRWDSKRSSLAGIKIVGHKKTDQKEFEAVYRVNKGIHQKTLFRLIEQAYASFSTNIPELIPLDIRQKYRLISHQDAVYSMHFPTDEEQSRQARRQIIFEELFLFQMKLQWLRVQEKSIKKGTMLPYQVEHVRDFITSLPFELTAAQKRVVNEICADLKSPMHMHRLLQGDVGSGKTIVAAIALFAVVDAGFQGALMVPTEILAEQHMESLNQLFPPLEVNIALLTGSTKPKHRKEILEQLADGRLNIIIGTHALIQEDVLFKQLGLVITDEQHRFGVSQRKLLRDKGEHPDVLFMTATPIPRTLAITAFGEMDVSMIDELPAGRIPISTTWVRPKMFETTLEFIETELSKGAQAYVICPLIEESESLDVKNTIDIYERLTSYYGERYQVGLLHGRMKPTEKEQIMHQFKQNQLQVLVSTTVIEVGVNVPNATTMVIYDADRFGLSQLHQLRGRVGRGSKKSHCILVANPKTEIGQERMKIMTETTDGFLLSEKDLALRGSGDLFGYKQSGIPAFKMADIVSDVGALEAARKEAQRVIQLAALQTEPQYYDLRMAIGIEQMEPFSFD